MKPITPIIAVSEELNLLDKCLLEIESKLNWGNRAEWTNHNFKELSSMIEESTNITLSVSSIRRLFGQDKSYKDKFNPQLETKNALVRFLGYENWASYKKMHAINTSQKTIIKLKWIKPAIITLLIIATYFFIYLFLVKPSKNKVYEYYFSGKNLTGTSPHTVAIHYDISKIKNENCYIEFGEYFNSKEPIKLSNSENIITHTYYDPYYYTIVLSAENKRLSTEKVLVQSNGWEYGAFTLLEDRKYFDIPNETTIGLQKLYLSPQILSKYKVDTTNLYYTEFKNIAEFNVNGDSLSFKTKLKLNEVSNMRGCYEANIWLLGEKQNIKIKLTNKGCSGLAQIEEFGDYKISGKNHELNSLSQDLLVWNDIEIKTERLHGSIYFNHEKIFDLDYTKNIGIIKGVHLWFTGSAEVDDIKLSNINNTINHQYSFD